jgi:hypothetical protein
MAKTGTDNVTYDLASVLYHALQGAETGDKYLQDAQGDNEAQQFFRQFQDENRRCAEAAKQLLAKRLGGGEGMRSAAGDKPSGTTGS